MARNPRVRGLGVDFDAFTSPGSTGLENPPGLQISQAFYSPHTRGFTDYCVGWVGIATPRYIHL